MWLFTAFGFFSVVVKPGDTQLTIRARVCADLAELRRRYLPSLSPTVATPHADYQYRATCTHATLAQAMAAIVTDIDVDNFKAVVEREQGHPRELVYARVWSALAAGLPPLNARPPRNRSRSRPSTSRSR